MPRTSLTELLEGLAERHSWRFFAKEREALGLSRGIGVSANDHGDELEFLFFARGANISSEFHISQHPTGLQEASDSAGLS